MINKIAFMLLLIVVLITGVFAGCNKKQEIPSHSSTVDTSQDVSNIEPSMSEFAEDEPAKTFNLPGTFKTHQGDEEHFYPQDTDPAAPYPMITDPEDYIVVMYDAHNNPAMFGEYVDGMGEVTAYQAFVFGQDEDGDTVLTQSFVKLVYENEKLAEDSVKLQERDDIYAVDNVAYISAAFGSALGADKAEILQTVYNTDVDEYDGMAYLSMTVGYEEFVK